MSYCVNCGVKLADSEKLCPLCETPVHNPRSVETEEDYAPYPPRVETQKINRSFIAVLGLLILLVPIVVTFVCDLLGDFRINWSFYVIGAALMLYVFVFVPMFFKKNLIYLFIAMDVLAVCLYLALIFWLTAGIKWFLTTALPIAAATGALVDCATLVFRVRKLRALPKYAILCYMLCVYFIVLEIILELAFYGYVLLQWCWYANAPLVLLGALLFIVNGKEGLVDELRRRLFT
ncbi:MAG TPA: DUF6320 domain-containing protein [Clostridia bacterium]|nr:DUF6320 domain-containing protein [Clostridia bacterium]